MSSANRLKFHTHNVYFIGCTHFGHQNIIKHTNAPFTSIKAYDEYLMGQILKTPDDATIFFLGDFAVSNSSSVAGYLSQINRKKYLIAGNHDSNIVNSQLKKQFKGCYDYLEINVQGQIIVLSHYPFVEWNKQYHGSWHLHAHQHGRGTYDKSYKILDVSANCIGYKPMSFLQVHSEMLHLDVPFSQYESEE